MGYIYFQMGGDDVNRKIDTSIDTPDADLSYGKYKYQKQSKNDVSLIYSNNPFAQNVLSLSINDPVGGLGSWYSIFIRYSGTFLTHRSIWKTKDAILLAQALSNRWTFKMTAYYMGSVTGSWNKVVIRIDMYKENIYGVQTALFNSPNITISNIAQNVSGSTNATGSISASDKIIAKISGAYLLDMPP